MKPQTSNYQKFATRNPIVRRLLRRYFRQLWDLVEGEPFDSVLDVGCGEGISLGQLHALLPTIAAGCDLNLDALVYAHRSNPRVDFQVGDVMSLPYRDKSIDLVLCLEVLEHLRDPRVAVRELARIARGRMVLSVPHEPWFRVGSLLRGNYWPSWGNHPEHIQQWNSKSFLEFLEQEVNVTKCRSSFPWILVEARRRTVCASDGSRSRADWTVAS